MTTLFIDEHEPKNVDDAIQKQLTSKSYVPAGHANDIKSTRRKTQMLMLDPVIAGRREDLLPGSTRNDKDAVHNGHGLMFNRPREQRQPVRTGNRGR